MIAHVFGRVVEKVSSTLIIDVHGVGYEVSVATGDFDKISLQDEIKLHTYHHIREQSQELFGFSSLVAKKLFEMLITVQGVGPKAALAILSLSDPENVRNAIANSDTTYIAKASGVGKKTAERVAVDLSDKVGHPTIYTQEPTDATLGMTADLNDEALEALMALGYNLADATAALQGVDASLSTSQRVTLALKR